MICPPDTLPGDDYLEDGLCHISVTGDSAMQSTQIKSMDGWNGVQLTCQNPPCGDYGSGPLLFCGEDLSNFCFIQPIESNTDDLQTEWECTDPSNTCNYRSTSFPTLSPTSQPTHDVNEKPANTLFVSQMAGCDVGHCQTNKFNKSTVCELGAFQDAACCSDFALTTAVSETINSDCNANNTVSINSTAIFENSVIGDVYNYSSGEGIKVACFDISNGFVCWSPKVVDVEYEQISYSTNVMQSFNVGFKTAQNRLNSVECRGTSESCGVFGKCTVDRELGDDIWTHNNGPYAFYFINGRVKISNKLA